MADDHDEPREEDHEVEPRPGDEVAAAVLERFPGTVFADSHGQAVVYVDRAVWRTWRPTCATSSSSRSAST